MTVPDPMVILRRRDLSPRLSPRSAGTHSIEQLECFTLEVVRFGNQSRMVPSLAINAQKVRSRTAKRAPSARVQYERRRIKVCRNVTIYEFGTICAKAQALQCRARNLKRDLRSFAQQRVAALTGSQHFTSALFPTPSTPEVGVEGENVFVRQLQRSLGRGLRGFEPAPEFSPLKSAVLALAGNLKRHDQQP